MIRINKDEKLCYVDDISIKLTKSEYNIIEFFLENPNKIFSREELIEATWKGKVSDRAVDTAISRLRKKLGDYGKCIVSRIGFGYGFVYNNHNNCI